MASELTTVERSRLRKLEKVIEEGVAHFVLVGNALREINQSQLYRQEYKSFTKYVEDRWSLKKTHAYDLIASAEVVESVRDRGQANPPKNIEQARELARAPKELQAEVWEEVCETNSQPTGKVVREKVKEKKAAAEPKKETVAASIVRDSLERDVPEALREQFAIGAQLAAIARKLDAIKREVVELADEDGGWFIPVQDIELSCKDLKGKIADAAYWTACPRCDGDGCDRCSDSGFLPKSMKGQLSHSDKETLGL